MSLRPESIESVPKQTVRVARTAFPKESREMLGIMDQLRYNDLEHASAPRTRSSPCMRVKLQLVMGQR